MNSTQSLYQKAVSILPAKDIDHHSSDLYLRKTAASAALIAEYSFPKNVTEFRDNIDHVLWYDIPFEYDPFWEGKKE
jgi:hypothetical protein